MEYTITSTQNPAVKAIKKLADAKARKESGLFLVESEKCVEEALKLPGLVKQLVILETESDKLRKYTDGFGGDIFLANQAVLETIATAKTPQGIIAVCSIEAMTFLQKDGLVVVLDGISDPGNLGTIIRTSDAAGAAAVYTMDESADVLSPKVIRASMGSVFHIPTKKATPADILALKENGYLVLGADLDGETEFSFREEKLGLVIGSEAHGISPEMTALVDRKIKIPMIGKAESLNAAVAAGILIYKIVGY